MKGDVWLRKPVLGMRMVRADVTWHTSGWLKLTTLNAEEWLAGYKWGPGLGTGTWGVLTGVNALLLPREAVECVVPAREDV